jgi:hypothetical protein
LERGVTLRQIVALQNGNVLLEGGIDRVDGSPTNGLAMLNPIGRKAATITPRCTPEPVIPGRNSCSVSFLPLRDGSFLLTAYVREPNQFPGWRITRYLADGSIDAQFQMPWVPSSIELIGPIGQSRDHIYVAYAGEGQSREVRRFPLTVPIQFDFSYLAMDVGSEPIVDDAGRLFDRVATGTSNFARRRDATGAIDGAWRVDLPESFRLSRYDQQSDRLFVSSATFSSVPREILRITPEGQIDPEWRLALLSGASRSRLKELVAFQPGRILNIQVVDGADRLVVNSTLDGRVLASRPMPTTDEIVMASGAAGSWIIADSASQNRSPIGSPLLRLNPDLSIDPDFTPNLRRPGVAFYATRADSGALLVAGEFSEVSGISRPKVTGLRADFSVDSTWPYVTHPFVFRSLSWVGMGPTGTLATAEFEPRTAMPYQLTVVSSTGQQQRRLRSIAPVSGWRGEFGSILVEGKLYGGEFCASDLSQHFPTGIWRFPLADELASPPPVDIPSGCSREPTWGPMPVAAPNGPLAYGDGFIYYVEGWFSSMRVRRASTVAGSLPDPAFLISAQYVNGTGQAISAMAVSAGYLYLTGRFETLNGRSITGLARFDLARGTLDANWPATSARRATSTIAIDAHAVYRVARIDDPPGDPISYELTRYRLPSGEASAPLAIERSAVTLPVGGPAAPRLLALGDGRVVVTGDFWRIGGAERDGLAVVGTTDPVFRDGFDQGP